jgi:hypothetical protein
MKPLWAKGTYDVPHLELTPEFEQALGFARRCGRLRGGLENISTLLQREEAGLVATRSRAGKDAPPKSQPTVSRLILVSNDGSDRFYRACESMLIRYQDRVFGLHLDVGSLGLGTRFFGKEAAVKIMMIDRKEFVVRALLALGSKGS